MLFGAAIAVAAFAQLAHTLTRRSEQGASDLGFYVQNFFSFFTIDSNLLSAATLLLGAVLLVTGRADRRWFTVVRLVTTTYMTVTLIVYNLLLRGIELPQGETLSWSNEILHVVGPLYVVIDWLFAPGRTRLEWRSIWVVVVFPVVWAAYTLLRGLFASDPVTGAPWYPYPFLNPDTSPGGYASVAGYLALISAIILGTAAAAAWVTRRDPRPSAHPAV